MEKDTLTRARRLLCVAALAVAASCGGASSAPKGPWPAARELPTRKVAEEEGFVFKLGEGAPRAPARAPVAKATPLDERATAAVVSRLPPMTKGEDDVKPWAVREASKPPPRPGKTIAEPFPPPRNAPPPEAPASGPLRVVRVSPEGEVGLAPSLAITFSEPMVAVSGVGDLERKAVPVKLTPEPPGKWRWLGTKTLAFEPSPRFPMATEFAVEVLAGTQSATGSTLAAATTARFATAPPRVELALPTQGPVRRDSVMLVQLDQRVDSAAVVPTIHVSAGKTAIDVRPATRAEALADPELEARVPELPEGRWVAFRSVKPLPPDARIDVRVGPGTPSTEGPRTTSAPHAWSFRTFGTLRVTKHMCGWGAECRPGMPLNVELTNPLDARRFDKGMVRASPEIPAMKVEVSGNGLAVSGRTNAKTTYEVTLAPTIVDAFGQSLGSAPSLKFEVGPAEKSLSSTRTLVVLDPAAGSRFSVWSVNHDALDVFAYAVGPEHWQGFWKWMARDRRGKRPPPPGKLVVSDTIDVEGSGDEEVETRIDLSPALRGGLGQLALVVVPSGDDSDDPRRQAVEAWVQATRIGLDAFVDATEMVAWATSLADGKPLGGVDLTLLPGSARAQSGASGVATIALGSAPGGLLVGRRGADVALLPENDWEGSPQGGWKRQVPRDELRWLVFDDRGMYRPGEEVKVKGWVRRVGLSKGGDVGPFTDAAKGVRWALRDARDNDIARGTASVSALGGFDLSLKLPPTINLGMATLTVASGGEAMPGSQQQHAIAVQEFRRPEFEVTTSAEPGPCFIGGHADITAGAAYYAGGPLPGAEVTWSVTATPGQFTPPNRDDFTFGRWVPWWDMAGFGPPSAGSTREQSLLGRTDAGGKHHLRIDMISSRPPRPTTVTAEASIQDVNRQAWASSSSVLVHPAAHYVGLRAPRIFVQQGEPLPIEAIVTDLDGKAIPSRAISIRAARVEWVQEHGVEDERELDPETCQVTSGEKAATCTFHPKEGGSYRVTATIADEAGRKNQTELTVWVAGDRVIPSRSVELERVNLVPGKPSYRAGETAEVLVLAPFSPAEGLMTIRRSGIVRTERFTLARASHTLRIPIEDALVPGVEVHVDLVGAAPRLDDQGQPIRGRTRPAFASGNVTLAVPPLARTLGLTATPRDAALEPGGQTVVDIDVRDPVGKPVAGAEVAVVVVDEAVLALSGYKTPDPLALFYAPRSGDTRDHHLRASVVLGRPANSGDRDGDGIMDKEDALEAGGYGPAPPPPPEPAASAAAKVPPDAPKPGGSKPPIRVRTDWSALATFAPAVPTGADGRAAVPVKLPDNLTRYRIMAVAVAGDRQFGAGESAVTGRLPLMVRASPPRFLSYGDRLELPVVVQNQTAAPIEVDVVARAQNASLTAGAGRRVKVAANDRVEVRFPAAAARPGTARFQVGAASGRFADAAEVSLPVWTPATTEAFATYGELDQGAVAQPVAAPSGAVPDFGGLEITTSSTALEALTDAVIYLSSYPFECAEQLASRVLAIAALRDVLSAFEAEGLPPPKALEARVKRDVDRLAQLQNEDGGFAFWRRGDESWPFLSIHVAHALVRARDKGFAVPAPVLERSKAYLRAVEGKIPKTYGPDERRAIVAYALATRARMGDRDVARARKLVSDAGDKLPLEAAGFVLPVLSGAPGAEAEVAAIRRLVNARVTETAGAAHFVTSYADEGYVLMHSDRRADALVLEAMIGDQPASDLIPKIVQGLLAHRTAGRWASTQENAFVLLALDRYFATYEKATPDFVARAWLGPRFAGEQRFKGRTTERRHVDVPMRDLVAAGAKPDLVIAKEGPGRLYYRVGVRYAPKDLRLPPTSQGFTVERAYEGVDDPGDVRRDPDGTWRVRAGARVRVRLRMLAPARRYHVALVDPLPAGLEPENPALAVTGSVPAAADARGSWWGSWYQHQNLRDERVEAFTTLLWEGLHLYDYVARATTPGTFVAPPPKAEEMYHPETFGRGASDRVIVE